MRFTKMLSLSALSAAVLLSGCNQEAVKADAQKPAQEVSVANEAQIFEVRHDGRLYVFYDMKTYHSFLKVGETPFQLTRIGGGPNGETLVFGLTKDDKKKGANTPAVELFDGKRSVDAGFYGEMRNHGRIYVFDNKADMDAVRKVGEPTYMLTQIGAGPKGETVVYVLNKENKKKQPVALMAKFKELNAI